MLKKMKKYIAVLLTVTLICSFGLTGCGTNSASNSKEATAENPMVLTLSTMQQKTSREISKPVSKTLKKS